MRHLGILVATGLLTACARAGPPVTLPPVVSRPPTEPAAGRGLAAGIGRADITPPPGLGLAGNGPEGRVAVGYRSRLYVRALLLEDERGERVAVVVADLPFISVLVQRRAAELLEPRTGVGADRLMLSATHTHAGPGHIEDGRLHNTHASQVPGYDSAFAGRVAAAIADAVSAAVDDLLPARAAWGSVPIWGLTRNRSLAAYQRNPERMPGAPPGLDSAGAAVDPTFTMLRVDVQDPADSVFRPAAALSVFAIHGTGNAPDNDLYDGDIHALVERAVESHIDSLAPVLRRSRAVHLFANGAEGDVSPAWPEESRCPRARLRPVGMHGGSHAPSVWEWLASAPAASDRCRVVARRAVGAIGGSLGRQAVALFDALRPEAAGNRLLVTRAFRTLPLVGPDAPTGLCAEPLVGASTVAGAEDAPTRFHGWRWLGFLPSAFREGGRAARGRPAGCQGEKRPAVPGITNRIFLGPHPLPEATQLAVVRVGGLVFAAVPAELTTISGRRVADSVRAAAARAGAPAEHVAVLGLTNGFIQYVATEQEYHAQHYEGGSTVYGPATSAVLASELATLTASMGGPTPTSPPVAPVPITVYPGPPRALLPARGSGPQRIERAWLRHECGDGAIVAEWRDASPGEVFPTSEFLLHFERLSGEGEPGEAVAWDDGPDVEVRALGPMRGGSWRWQVRWPAPAAGRSRLVLAARGAIPKLSGPACDVGGVSGP